MVSAIVVEVCEAICRHLQLTYLPEPTTEIWKKSEEGFRNPLQGSAYLQLLFVEWLPTVVVWAQSQKMFDDNIIQIDYDSDGNDSMAGTVAEDAADLSADEMESDSAASTVA
ncbi:unnamed protein product [Diabrotica balteata]|uniref:Uncharacterized protein n=1 Tax=Diabrotica balteata TaxID=107213 RepID=A0A9N9X961_DIABA|nr:unnamed protein product [Diabrotica balteata]